MQDLQNPITRLPFGQFVIRVSTVLLFMGTSRLSLNHQKAKPLLLRSCVQVHGIRNQRLAHMHTMVIVLTLCVCACVCVYLEFPDFMFHVYTPNMTY